MKKIRINIELPKASVIQRDLNNLIKQIDKNTSIKLDLDTNNFNKSLGEITQSIARLKTHVSSISGLDKIFEASAINSSTQAIEKRNQAIKEQQRIMESELSKVSNVKLVNADGTETIIKDLRTIKDEYGNIIETVNKYNSKTGELTSTIVKTTNEIEKQRIANENALKERQKIEEDYENWWLKSLKNREIKEDQLYQKNLSSTNKLKEQMQSKLNESLRNQNFTLVDDKVFTSLQNKINSINTDTSVKEINELKIALDNLGNSDSQIVRLQNAITKQEISIASLKEMYKDLIPKNELKKAEDSLNSLKNILDEIQDGKSYNNLNIRYNLDQASASMKDLTSSAKNAVEQQKLLNEETVTFGSALKEIATSAGVFNIVNTGIDKIKSAFREGIESVIEMDTELSNLQKVIDGLSDKQLIKMRDNAVEIGTALGRSSTEIMASFAEFGKQFKDTDIVSQLSELSVMATNTMENISADQVSKSLTTILASMELEVDDAKKILDGLNEIQNNFRINSSDLLEGLAEVGSVAKTSGVELDRLNGFITSIVTTTGGSGSEVGNALQTIFSRIYGVGKKTLEDIGVAVTDLNGEFRSATDILDDYYKRWQSMSDTERITSAQSIAGVQRYNQLVALMNNYDTAIQAAEISLNSLDSVQKENEVYLNSIEGRMNSLKTATEGFWYDLISSDMIKSGVSALQLLINALSGLQNTFGSLGLSVGVLSTAFLMFTNNPLKTFSERVTSSKGLYKNFKEELDKSIITIKKTATETYGLDKSMSTAQKSGVLLKAGFKELGVAIDATKIKAIALQSVLSMGLSLAISAIIGAISSFVSSMFNADESMEKVKQSAKELGDTLTSINDSKADFSSYEEINKKLEDTNLSEKERKELNNQLVDVKEKLYAIDDEAYAILNNQNLTYQEQLNLLKAINDEKLKEKGRELDESLGNGFWRQDEEKNAKFSAETLGRQIEIYKEAEELFKNANGDFIQLSNGVTVAVKDQVKYMEELRNSMIENSNTVQSYNSKVELIKQTNVDTDRSTVELSGSIKAFVSDLIKATQAIDENTKAKEKNSNIDGTGTMDTGASVEDSTKKYSEALSQAQELYDLIEAINKSQSMTPELVKKVVDIYPDIGTAVTSVAETQEFLNGKFKEAEKLANQAYETMVENDNNYYQNKLLNDENWIETFRKSLISMGMSAEDAYNLDLKQFQNLQQLKTYAMNQLGDGITKWLSQYIDTSENGYNIDFRNFKSYSEAKLAILSALNQEIKKVTENLSTAQKMADTASKMNTLFGGLGAEGKFATLQAQKAQSDIEKYTNQLNNLNGALNEVENKISGISAGGITSGLIGSSPIGMSSGGSKGNKGSSNKKEIQDMESLVDRYHDLKDAINDLNNELKINKLLQESATGQQKIKLMEREIELYKKQQQAIKNLIAEQKKEAQELKNALSGQGVTFNSSGDISNYNQILTAKVNWANSLSGKDKEKAKEQVKALEEAMKSYDELVNKSIPSQEQEWESLNNTIKDVYKTQATLIANMEKNISETIEYELKKRYDAKKKALNKEKELYNKEYDEANFEEEMNTERNKLAEIQAEIDKVKNDNSRQGQLRLKQLLKEYEEQQKLINDKIKEQQNQAINDRFNQEEELLDKELEDMTSSENLSKLVAEAISSGMIKIGNETINVQNSMNDMLKETEIGFANVALQQSEWINNLEQIKVLYSSINSIMGNAGMTMPLYDKISRTRSMGDVSITTGGITIAGNADSSTLGKIQEMLDAQAKEIYKNVAKKLG